MRDEIKVSRKIRFVGNRHACSLLLVGMVIFCNVGMAEEVAGVDGAVKVELPSKIKEISGLILARTRTNLSVETSQDGSSSMEYIVPFDKTTKLRGYRNFADIRKGDTISARLKQSYEVDEKGKELVRGTIAAQISLVKSSQGGKLVG